MQYLFLVRQNTWQTEVELSETFCLSYVGEPHKDKSLTTVNSCNFVSSRIKVQIYANFFESIFVIQEKTLCEKNITKNILLT